MAIFCSYSWRAFHSGIWRGRKELGMRAAWQMSGICFRFFLFRVRSFFLGSLSFFLGALSFLSGELLVFAVTAERCSPLRRTRVHRYGGKVFTVTANTNAFQEKNDKSLEKSIATTDKNVFLGMLRMFVLPLFRLFSSHICLFSSKFRFFFLQCVIFLFLAFGERGDSFWD